MARKTNRTWATRAEAIGALANNPNMSGTDLLASLFNSDAAQVGKEVAALQSSVIERKRQEAARLQKEADDAAKAAAPQPKAASK